MAGQAALKRQNPPELRSGRALALQQRLNLEDFSSSLNHRSPTNPKRVVSGRWQLVAYSRTDKGALCNAEEGKAQNFAEGPLIPADLQRHLQWRLPALTSSHSKPLTMKVSHSLHLDGPRSFRSRWVCAALERRMFLNCCWDVPFSAETALKREKEPTRKHGFHLVRQKCVRRLTVLKSLQGISLFKII